MTGPHAHDDRPKDAHEGQLDGHDHDHGGHDHLHRPGPTAVWRKLSHVMMPHSHDSAAKVDSAMETSRDGIRVLWISLAVLGATAIMQAVVVLLSAFGGAAR